MFGFIKQWFSRKTASVAFDDAEIVRRPASVAFDDARIVRTSPSGQAETIHWEDLREVDIVTTNEGPWFEDVFWVLRTEEKDLVVPSETDGMQLLLQELQHLPGFDNEMVIRAMGCTDNNWFLVWLRPL